MSCYETWTSKKLVKVNITFWVHSETEAQTALCKICQSHKVITSIGEPAVVIIWLSVRRVQLTNSRMTRSGKYVVSFTCRDLSPLYETSETHSFRSYVITRQVPVSPEQKLWLSCRSSVKGNVPTYWLNLTFGCV